MSVLYISVISSIQLSSITQPCSAPWSATHQASLSFTNTWSLLKLMSIELVMPSNPLILCHPLLLPSIFPSIRGLNINQRPKFPGSPATSRCSRGKSAPALRILPCEERYQCLPRRWGRLVGVSLGRLPGSIQR